MREGEIGARATCVVGVAAALDEGGLLGLRGRVELTIACGERSASVRGRMNPAFRVGDPLVLRRAGAVTRDAVVIDADAAAADLDRELVGRLAEPGAVVEIRFRELDEAAPGALIVGLTGAPEGLLDAFGGHSDQKRPGTQDLAIRSPLAPDDAARALSALDGGARVSLIAALDADPAATALIAAAHDAGHDVLPADGLDPRDAALAVAGIDPASATVATSVPADRIGAWLRNAVFAERAALILDPGTPREQVMPWRAGEKAAIPGARGRTAVIAVGAPAAGGGPSPALLARVRELAATGTSTRDLARLLRDEGGLARAAAYELALELVGQTAETNSVSRPDPRTNR